MLPLEMDACLPGCVWNATPRKNLPAMQETWVQFLGRKDPLEKEMATHSSILAWKIPVDRRDWWAAVYGVIRVEHN